MESDFLNSLNPSQDKAVRYVDGPSLVIAGAGSGKTRVLTYKIAYLLRLGLKPWEILALTFTNKAAREMKERICSLVGDVDSRYLWMGTFHSLFNRMLRTEAAHIGYAPNYTIYQPGDCISLIKAILKEMGLDDKVYKPSAVLGRISEAKNALVLPDDYCRDRDTYSRDEAKKMPALGEIYRRYCGRCRKADVMDFDDLLLHTYLLFERFQEVREKYASRFKYILVDEYQDTNWAQYRILWQLSEKSRHICVVGDDAQSIYSFRGARIDNILKFTTQYEGAKIFKLEQNYRSTQTIVGAANSLISCNRHQIKKEVYSKNEVGRPIILNEAFSDVAEGEIVTNHIVNLHTAERLDYSSTAILYRTNAQSRIFEDSLRKHAIPYRIYGGRSFYDQKVIRDALAYFRLIVNPNDEEAFKRIVNFPARGIGQTTLSRVMTAVAENDSGIWDVLDRLAELVPSVSAATRTKLLSFKAMIDGFIEKLDTADACQIGMDVIKESGLLALAHQNQNPESIEMRDNFSELLNGMNSFVDNQREADNADHTGLSDYLSEVSLLSDQDERETEGKDMVTLMTIHAAKGLEFDAVFITGLEENLFPNALSMNNPRELEEERRLFYVAITRASKYCYLSYSKMRYHFGSMDFCEPSRFLRDIDSQYIRKERSKEENNNGLVYGSPRRNSLFTDENDVEGIHKSGMFRRQTIPPQEHKRLKSLGSSADVKTEGRQRKETTYFGRTLKVGQKVVHAKFGRGIVKSIEGEDGATKAVIRFEQMGEKHLLLKYAKITLL